MIIEPLPFASKVYGDCTRCGLHQTRDRIVLGVGDHHADVMIIGEGPGPTEDMKGLPFVGQAGITLNSMISAVGWDRDELFVDNLCACWPCREDPETGRWLSRKPTKEEINACRFRITETIRRVDPLVIIALGGTALQGLTGDGTNITRARGELFYAFIPGVYKPICYPVFPTFHPSYINRRGESGAVGERDASQRAGRAPKRAVDQFKADFDYVRKFTNTLREHYGRRRL